MAAFLTLLTALAALASPATSRAAPTSLPPPSPCVGCWHPAPTTDPWQWQLQGRLDLSIRAPVYDIDIDSPASAVEAIHDHSYYGGPDKAVCYVDVGSWEPYRSDAGQFPKRVLGRHSPASRTSAGSTFAS